MHPSRRGGWWTVTVAVVTVVVLLAAYVGSYFAFTLKTYWLLSGSGAAAVRVCRYPWMVPLYKPLAVAEETITGDVISVQ